MRRIQLLLAALLILLAGCTIKIADKGVTHTVGPGETLWRICHTYGVDVDRVARVNGIDDPTSIKAGSRIYIPGVSRRKHVVPYNAPASTPRVRKASVKRDPGGHIEVEKGRFSWPLKGTLTSEFGLRDGERHDGIDISAPRGTGILAADDGTVVVDDHFRSYGNIVIIRHKGDYYTVYAHNRKNLVTVGDRVSKGDTIAYVGSTGNATGNHLHFEIRKGKKVVNPLFYLP